MTFSCPPCAARRTGRQDQRFDPLFHRPPRAPRALLFFIPPDSTSRFPVHLDSSEARNWDISTACGTGGQRSTCSSKTLRFSFEAWINCVHSIAFHTTFGTGPNEIVVTTTAEVNTLQVLSKNESLENDPGVFARVGSIAVAKALNGWHQLWRCARR